MIIATTFIIFFTLCILSVPIALTLVLSAVIPFALFTEVPISVLAQRLFTAMDSYSLMAIPFFLIAGGFLDKGGVAKRLMNFAKALFGWLPGGLAVVSFFTCAFFGAICGAATATVVAVGSIMLPFMLEDGYPLRFSLATVAAGGYLGIIVPPSIPMVLYGVATGVSVGDLFLGGVIPGFLLAGGMSVYAVIYGIRHKMHLKLYKFSAKEVGRSFVDAIWALIMPGIILGGIYGGVFTPTEAAAVASLYGAIIGLFIYQELTFGVLLEIIKNAVISSAMIMFVISAASCFAYLLAMQQIPTIIANGILSFAKSPMVFWLVTMILLFFVGCIMDTPPSILIMAPLLAPLASQYNIDPIVFGIVMIVNLGIGLCTPPVGLSLYVAANLRKAKAADVICGHLGIYLICSAVVMTLLIIFPSIILLLPSLTK
jgi:C4-dicarboxylate transporter DctM subunit